MKSNPIFCPLPAAGCTFEEDSDPNLCDFTQGEEDDFDWVLFRTYSSPLSSFDLLKGRHFSAFSPLLIGWSASILVNRDDLTETKFGSKTAFQSDKYINIKV